MAERDTERQRKRDRLRELNLLKERWAGDLPGWSQVMSILIKVVNKSSWTMGHAPFKNRFQPLPPTPRDDCLIKAQIMRIQPRNRSIYWGQKSSHNSQWSVDNQYFFLWRETATTPSQARASWLPSSCPLFTFATELWHRFDPSQHAHSETWD